MRERNARRKWYTEEIAMRSLILSMLCVLSGCTLLSGFDDYRFEADNDSGSAGDGVTSGYGGSGGSGGVGGAAGMSGSGGAGGDDAGLAGVGGSGGVGGEADAGVDSSLPDVDASVDAGTDSGVDAAVEGPLAHQCEPSSSGAVCPAGYTSRFSGLSEGFPAYGCLLVVPATGECPSGFGLFKTYWSETESFCMPNNNMQPWTPNCTQWRAIYGARL